MLKEKKNDSKTENINRNKGQKTHNERRINKSVFLEVRIKNIRKME